MNTFAWTARDVTAALGLPELPGDDRIFPRISTDTRTLQQGDLFVALRGARFIGLLPPEPMNVPSPSAAQIS